MEKEACVYLEATRVEPFDSYRKLITLSIGGSDGSFIHTPEPPFSKLERPIETLGGISELLKSENSEAVFFLSVQVLHALGRRQGAGGVGGAVHGGVFLLMQFGGRFTLLFEEETLHLVTTIK